MVGIQEISLNHDETHSPWSRKGVHWYKTNWLMQLFDVE